MRNPQIPAPINTNGSKVSNPAASKKRNGTSIPTLATIRPTGPNVVSLLTHRDRLAFGSADGNGFVGPWPTRVTGLNGAAGASDAGAPALGGGEKKSKVSSADAVIPQESTFSGVHLTARPIDFRALLSSRGRVE